MNAIVPNHAQVSDVIRSMGVDNVVINTVRGVVYVSFYKRGGCGRIHVNICNYLKKYFPDKEIVVLESPQVDTWCQRARVRKIGANHFSRTSIRVTPNILGMY